MAESKSVTVVPLNGSNYGTWKVQCRMALVKNGLWSIVSGTETAPAATEELSLRRRLNNLRLKDGDSMSNHIKAMTEIFNELAVIGAAMEDEDKVVRLLASVPEAYNMLVTALEASTEVPQMEVVIECLLYEEKKLGEREKSPIPSSRVMVASGHKGNKKFIKCHHCGKLGHIRRFCKDLNKDKSKKEPGNQGNKNKGNQVEKGSRGLVRKVWDLLCKVWLQVHVVLTVKHGLSIRVPHATCVITKLCLKTLLSLMKLLM